MRVAFVLLLSLALVCAVSVEAARDGSLRAKLARLRDPAVLLESESAAASGSRTGFVCLAAKGSSAVWACSSSSYCAPASSPKNSGFGSFEAGVCISSKPSSDVADVTRRPYNCPQGCASGQCCMPPEVARIDGSTVNTGVCKSCPSYGPPIPDTWKNAYDCGLWSDPRTALKPCGNMCCGNVFWQGCMMEKNDPLKRECLSAQNVLPNHVEVLTGRNGLQTFQADPNSQHNKKYHPELIGKF